VKGEVNPKFKSHSIGAFDHKAMLENGLKLRGSGVSQDFYDRYHRKCASWRAVNVLERSG
jgi:hypothetical protein